MPFDSITIATKQVTQPRASAAVNGGSDPTVDNRFIRALDAQIHFLATPATFDSAASAALRACLLRWQGGLYG